MCFSEAKVKSKNLFSYTWVRIYTCLDIHFQFPIEQQKNGKIRA